MYKFHRKLKQCRAGLLEWRKKDCLNSGRQIDGLRKDMQRMQEQGGNRDWGAWTQLRSQLDDVYKIEEEYWARKSRIEWLQAGDRNTKYFHAITRQKRRRNQIERLEKKEGGVCEGVKEIGQEIAKYFNTLFTTSIPFGDEDILEGIPRKSLTQ